MARAFISCIQRTCPHCGTENRVVTTEASPNWRINCSHCGTPLVERPGRVAAPAPAEAGPEAEPVRPCQS